MWKLYRYSNNLLIISEVLEPLPSPSRKAYRMELLTDLLVEIIIMFHIGSLLDQVFGTWCDPFVVCIVYVTWWNILISISINIYSLKNTLFPGLCIAVKWGETQRMCRREICLKLMAIAVATFASGSWLLLQAHLKILNQIMIRFFLNMY